MITVVLVACAIGILAWCVGCTVRAGKKCAVSGHASLPAHQRAVNHTLFATIALILLIETLSQLSTTHATGGWLFKVHLAFAVPFVLLLVLMRFWITGLRWRSAHRVLAYTVAFCFVGVFVTGLSMLWSMV